MLFKSYKYRIYPTKEQESLMTEIFGQVRFIYNLGLEIKNTVYSAYGENLTYFDLTKQLTELKNTECPWLKIVPSQVLDASLKDLDNGFTRFFNGQGYPRFKNINSKQSFRIRKNISLKNNNKQIRLPKLGLVNIHLHRTFNGIIKYVTVYKTKTNKYFVSICFDTQTIIPEKKPINKERSIGIDLGIKTFAATSNGKKFENQKFLKSEQKQLRIIQRTLSRRKKGSKHYEEARLQFALLHERIANKRLDFLQKLSKWFIDNYDTIIIEDLAVQNMMKNHNLAMSIADAGWGYFRQMLIYKGEWYGKNVIVIDRYAPSSKKCSACGEINSELTLNDREWTCSCGVTHDRDLNAAINIKNFGLSPKKAKKPKKTTGLGTSLTLPKVDNSHACNVETK